MKGANFMNFAKNASDDVFEVFVNSVVKGDEALKRTLTMASAKYSRDSVWLDDVIKQYPELRRVSIHTNAGELRWDPTIGKLVVDGIHTEFGVINGYTKVIVDSTQDTTGLYRATVFAKNTDDILIAKNTNSGMSTLFPKTWSKLDVANFQQFAWDSIKNTDLTKIPVKAKLSENLRTAITTVTYANKSYSVAIFLDVYKREPISIYLLKSL